MDEKVRKLISVDSKVPPVKIIPSQAKVVELVKSIP